MTPARSLGVFVKGYPWGIGQPFSSRIPPAASIRRPRTIGDLVPADHGGFMTTLQVRKGVSGVGCGCGGSCGGCGGHGMGSISTDFSAMMNGTAPISTYAMYGGGLIVGMMILRSMGGRRR